MDQATSLAAVALNDVAITFGPKVGGYTAVSGIDLSVRPGEFVAIVGPHGIGQVHDPECGRRPAEALGRSGQDLRQRSVQS
jgi:ABC-type uncharacterized transport system ATPase subunit